MVAKQMNWFNEPEKWSFKDNTIYMYVTPKTDYWRKTHYGFTVDDGPFFYSTLGGEFEAIVKISGDYQARYDQMGLMIRKDEKTWIKTGIEYVNEKMNVSAVVTIENSDWSMVELPNNLDYIWVKVLRRLDAVEISYSPDNTEYRMMRLAFFPPDCPVMVGVTAASPDGEGFDATFENFQIRHLPDHSRLKWLESNR